MNKFSLHTIEAYAKARRVARRDTVFGRVPCASRTVVGRLPRAGGAAAPSVPCLCPGGALRGRSQYWAQRARNPPWYVESWDSNPSGCDGQSGADDSWLKSGCDAPCDSDSGGC